MPQTKPIFVIGLGRSGSSIFHKMFARHHQVAWLSSLCEKFPKRPELNSTILNLIDSPLIGDYFANRFTPEECYNFWENYCNGFRMPCRDLRANDLTPKSKAQIKLAFEKVTTKKRNRLMLKITGWPRVEYVNEIYKDSIFINVQRDPYSVANSFLAVNWWLGWRGPSNWRWGPLSEEYMELWNKYDKSFVALAGIACLIFQDTVIESKKNIAESRFIDINYEELCVQPVDIFRHVIEKCELEWTNSFESTINSYNLKNTNYKWRQDLSKEQQEVLEDVLSNYKQ